MPLTQKEKSLLQDLRAEEQLCAEKYCLYSNEASDAQLQKMFKQIQKKEETHINMVNEMLDNKVPTPKNKSGSASQSKQSKEKDKATASKKADNAKSCTGTATSAKKGKEHDQYMCSDCLAMEKHVSGVYNTSIFEFDNEGMRNTLNRIQKEEQHHGDQIAKYMESHNMYC